jgi:hypothetical protein
MNKLPSRDEEWQKALRETRKITDKIGMSVDPKVVTTVAAMRLHGFCTVASCEGHLDRMTSGPFVKFESLKAAKCFHDAEVNREHLIAAGKLKDKLNEGRVHTWREMQRMYHLIESYRAKVGSNEGVDEPMLMVRYVMNRNIYLHCYGVEFLNLYEREGKRKMLAKHQKAMQSFAEYLKEVYVPQ